MAHLSEDHDDESFKNGEDIHSSTARKVFNIAKDPTSDREKKAAKTINFRLIYGISAYGLARQLKIDNAEAKNIIDTYFKHKRVKEFMEELKESASKMNLLRQCMEEKYLFRILATQTFK